MNIKSSICGSYPTYVYQFFNFPYNYKNRLLACFQTRPMTSYLHSLQTLACFPSTVVRMCRATAPSPSRQCSGQRTRAGTLAWLAVEAGTLLGATLMSKSWVSTHLKSCFLARQLSALTKFSYRFLK